MPFRGKAPNVPPKASAGKSELCHRSMVDALKGGGKKKRKELVQGMGGLKTLTFVQIRSEPRWQKNECNRGDCRSA